METPRSNVTNFWVGWQSKCSRLGRSALYTVGSDRTKQIQFSTFWLFATSRHEALASGSPPVEDSSSLWQLAYIVRLWLLSVYYVCAMWLNMNCSHWPQSIIPLRSNAVTIYIRVALLQSQKRRRNYKLQPLFLRQHNRKKYIYIGREATDSVRRTRRPSRYPNIVCIFIYELHTKTLPIISL